MPNKDERDVQDLVGQELLDALTAARRDGTWKGWTFGELLRGPSVLPATVYDEKNPGEPILKYTCVVGTSFTGGEIGGLTLMVTTKDGTYFQDFVRQGGPHRV